MAPARRQSIVGRERDRFPTEWALYEGDEQECGRHRINWGMLDPETGRQLRQRRRLGARPAGQPRLDRQLDGAASLRGDSRPVWAKGWP
jgi:hypothetical protein